MSDVDILRIGVPSAICACYQCYVRLCVSAVGPEAGQDYSLSNAESGSECGKR